LLRRRIIRTAGNPFKGRPSGALAATVIGVVAAAVIIPFTPLGPILGFVALPFSYFVFLAAATVTYLLLVEIVKRRLMGRL
jgi:Mg2+-importing ATPase